jgi:predicted TIM-barrel fold metal-dependent hydrolase
VWYDSAASTYLYDHRVAGIVESLVGAKRILWGSDYPVLRQKRFLERFLEHVSTDGVAAMTSGNALSVYQIDLPGVDS